jgi:hypothetical protein
MISSTNNEINNNTKINTSSNSVLMRTPLQPKSINKNSTFGNNEVCNIKSITPIKLVSNQKNINYFNDNNKNPVKLPNKFEVAVENNNELQHREEISQITPNYDVLLNDYTSREEEYIYNINKHCCDKNHLHKCKIVIKDCLTQNLCFSTEEKSMSILTEESEDDPLVMKAMNFFENENIVYVNILDLKNREKINDYVNDGLYFSDIIIEANPEP